MKEDKCRTRAMQQLQQRECDNKVVMNIKLLAAHWKKCTKSAECFCSVLGFHFCAPILVFVLILSLSLPSQQTDDTFAEIFVLPLLTLATSSMDHNTSLSLSLSLFSHTHTNTHNPKTSTLIHSLNPMIHTKNSHQHKNDVNPKMYNSIQSLHSCCAHLLSHVHAIRHNFAFNWVCNFTLLETNYQNLQNIEN